MATASDDFNRADGALGANWTTAHNGGGQIISNAYAPVTGGTSEAAFYSGTTFLTNHYSQATRSNAGEYAALAVRCSVGGNYYAWFSNGSLQKFVSGGYTILGTFATFGVGSVIRLEIIGNTLQGFIAGVSQFTYTDSSAPLTTGQPGLATYNTSGGRLDDWSGGDLAPSLTRVAPASGERSTTVAVTLTGSAFISGATVAVSGTGVTVSDVVVVSATSITANVAIDSSATVGVRAVSVTTTNGTSGSGSFIVRDTSTAVAVDDFNRADGAPGANWTLLANGGMLISGNGVIPNGLSEAGHFYNATAFDPDHYSQVTRIGTGNYGGPAVRCSWGGSTTTATCIFWTNSGGVRRMIGGGITVLTTQVGYAPGDVATLTIVGTTLQFFVNGVLVGTLVDSGAPTTGSPGIVFGNNIDTPVVKLDDWSGGDLTSSAVALPPPLTLTSISPPAGTAGTTVAVTLSGTAFVVGDTTVTVSGTGITVTDVVVAEDGETLTAAFVIDAAAAAGPRDVTVTTDEGTTDPVTFTVLIGVPGPTLASLTPSTGTLGTTVAVTITGTGFVVGSTTVAVSGEGVSVVVTSVVVSSATTLTAAFVIDASSAALGVHLVTVTTVAGTSAPLPFTVVPLTAAPTLFTLAPSAGLQGTSVAVVLTGTGFVPGATTLAVSGTGVTAASVFVSETTVLSATLVIAAGATLGARTVTVTTPEGTSGPLPFTVLAPGAGGIPPAPGVASAYQSRSAVCFSGVALSSNTTRHLHIWLHGTHDLDVTCDLMDSTGFTITKQLSGGVSEMTFAIRSLVPGIATPVTVDLGLVPLWGGNVMTRTSTFLDDLVLVHHEVGAVDWRWLLDRWRLVSGTFQAIGVNVLVAKILREYVDPASGFTPGDIAMGLGDIPLIEFSDVTVSEALTRIAQATTATLYGAGAFWRIRPDKAVDVGVQWADAPLRLQTTGPLPICYEDLTHQRDGAQLRNEIIVLAGGAKVSATTRAGAVEIPVTNGELYPLGGGVVRCSGIDITYAGVRPTGVEGVLFGCTGITRDLAEGDEVQPLVTTVDAASQAAIATALGAGQSGVVTVSRENRQLSWAEAQGAATGELAQFATPVLTFSYGLTTPGARLVDVGKLVDASLELPGLDPETPADVIAGLYRVQECTFTSITSPALAGPDPRLRATLSASPARARSWYDLVKQEPDRKAR